MRPPLERLRTLTLALEAAIAVKDWPTANALLETREAEIKTLTPGAYAQAEDILKLDVKLQANLEAHMNGLRKRMQAVNHVKRTARAFQNVRNSQARIDFAG